MARACITEAEALAVHREPTPGTRGAQPSKPMAMRRDPSLASSPGVAVPDKAATTTAQVAR